MSTISASLVMELRERTGAGMMECKKFLVAANGNIEEAIAEMRKAGQAKADKIAGRIAGEGCIAIAKSNELHKAVMIEGNCETDFVAKDKNFISFIEAVAQTVLESGQDDIDLLANQTLSGSNDTVEQNRQQLVAKIGENIQLRRIQRLETDGVIGTYMHGSRIGVMVALKKGDEQLAKDIAMHIAASKPLVIYKNEVPETAIQKEREIYLAQASESGKPQDIIEKMVQGRINKYLDEVSLVGQPFIKNPDIKIEKLLQDHQAEIAAFTRFEVGEGIQKREDNFVAEVMAQVRGS